MTMESPTRAISRLVAALETLVEHEAQQIAVRDHAGVLRTQRKVGLIVQKLAQIGSAPADADARARMARLLANRRRSQQQIASRIAHLRQELARVGSGRSMLSKIVPLYGGVKRPAVRRLSALT
jgi:hypothetical protein